MRPYFEYLADAVCQPVAGIDRVTLYYSAESSDFIRFNRAAVRQATHVSQRYGSVSVVAGARQATGRITLCGDAATDVQSLLAERDLLIAQLPLVVNFDLPLVAEDYVHRVGRTGRAGHCGRAVSLVSGSDSGLLREIQRIVAAPLERVAAAGLHATSTRPPVDRQRPMQSRNHRGQRPASRGGQRRAVRSVLSY